MKKWTAFKTFGIIFYFFWFSLFYHPNFAEEKSKFTLSEKWFGYWVSENDESKYNIAIDMKYLTILNKKTGIEIGLHPGERSTYYREVIFKCNRVNVCKVIVDNGKKTFFTIELLSDERIKIKTLPLILIPGWQPGTEKKYILFGAENEIFKKINKEDFPYPDIDDVKRK